MTDSEQIVSGEASTGAADNSIPPLPKVRVSEPPPSVVEQADPAQPVPTDVVLTGQVPVEDRVIGKPLTAEQAQAIRDRINQTRDSVRNPEPAPEPEPSPSPEPEPEPERVEQPVDGAAVPPSMGGASTEPRGPAPDSTDTPIFDSIGGTQ